MYYVFSFSGISIAVSVSVSGQLTPASILPVLDVSSIQAALTLATGQVYDIQPVGTSSILSYSEGFTCLVNQPLTDSTALDIVNRFTTLFNQKYPGMVIFYPEYVYTSCHILNMLKEVVTLITNEKYRAADEHIKKTVNSFGGVVIW